MDTKLKDLISNLEKAVKIKKATTTNPKIALNIRYVNEIEVNTIQKVLDELKGENK